MASILSLEEVNRFLEGYLPGFNAQFKHEALRPGDLHRPLPKTLNHEEIFCLKSNRTINNSYFIRWKGKRFAIVEPSRRMQGRLALVMEHFGGRMIVRYEGLDLGYLEIREREIRSPVVPVVRPNPPKHTTPATHPWRLLPIKTHSPLLSRGFSSWQKREDSRCPEAKVSTFP